MWRNTLEKKKDWAPMQRRYNKNGQRVTWKGAKKKKKKKEQKKVRIDIDYLG